jgi:hypothetical protein
MIDLKEATGDNAGYQLRINYVAAKDQYSVTGYVVFNGKNETEYDRDGATLFFKTSEEMMKYLNEVK